MPTFKKLNNAVYVPSEDVTILSDEAIDALIDIAKTSPKRRARYLLHHSQDDSLHEMAIALPQESCDIPHINFQSGKSFCILRGMLAVVLFSDDGEEITPVILNSGNQREYNFLVRLNKPVWHTIIPLSEYVVFLETILGPFTGNRFASWAPENIESEEGKIFSERLRAISRTAI